jgi:uncharacterized protein
MGFGEVKVLDRNQSPKLGLPLFTDRKAQSRGIPRVKAHWPTGKPFRILSLDGGGIRGLYTACLLSSIETEFCKGGQVGRYFDLIAGTSTGGIIAMGLAFSIPCEQIVNFYRVDGEKIFPPFRFEQAQKRSFRFFRDSTKPKYDHRPLEKLLFQVFGESTLGDADARLVIPSCMVPISEIAVFKTDHHSDYKRDYKTAAWEVCRATSAAPTYFKGHERNGKMFVDGGLWANNPILVAIAEALSCFDITPSQIEVLSIGTGSKPFEISLKEARGGWFHWKYALTGAMHLSTENAASQAALFIGDDNVLRVEPEHQISSIEMDDWVEAVRHLPDAAQVSFAKNHIKIRKFFELEASPRDKFRA